MHFQDRHRTAKTARVACLLSLLSMSWLFLSAARWGQASPELYWGAIRSKQDVDRLKSIGVKSIINVRTNPKTLEGAYARSLGMKYFHIRTGVVKPPTMAMVREFLKIVCDPANLPAYVGCQGGRDRTAFYVAAYKIARQGVPATKAASWMSQQGLQGRKLRMWWPTFRRYDDVLIQNENEIRRLAQQYQSANTARALGKRPINIQ